MVAPYPSTSGYIARDELQTTKKETPWGGLRAGRPEAREAVSRCSRSRAGLFRRMRSIPKRPRHRIPVGFYDTAPLTVPVSINLGQSPRKTDLKIPCSVRFIRFFLRCIVRDRCCVDTAVENSSNIRVWDIIFVSRLKGNYRVINN